MLLSSAFTFFFGPKKAQFIMNAASRNRDLEISGAKTLTECLSLVLLLISNLTNELRLHQFLLTKTTEANKSLKSDANGAH